MGYKFYRDCGEVANFIYIYIYIRYNHVISMRAVVHTHKIQNYVNGKAMLTVTLLKHENGTRISGSVLV